MVQATAAWRHKMNIAPYIASDDITNDVVNKACSYIMSEIDKITEREQRRKDGDREDQLWYIGKLQDLKGEFDCVLDSDDSIDSLQEQFNWLLEDLYDIGDSRIKLKNGTTQKFLWVGAM